MCYEYITKIEIKFDKKKTFKRKSIKYLQNFIFQESVKLPGINKSLLSQYIYGIKIPSDKRMKEIKTALNTLGKELIKETE